MIHHMKIISNWQDTPIPFQSLLVHVHEFRLVNL
jgi:hypothetical protein